jgi:hypothetical protein
VVSEDCSPIPLRNESEFKSNVKNKYANNAEVNIAKEKIKIFDI